MSTTQRADPHPVVVAYPKCPTCGAAYVLRRCMSLSQGWVWLWQRDCKHRSPPEVVDRD